MPFAMTSDLPFPAYRAHDVPSDYNLASFSAWFCRLATPADREAANGVYLVEHTRNTAGRAEPIGLRYTDPETGTRRRYQIPVLDCQDVGCARCDAGVGGYKFDWVGPWTCKNGRGTDANTSRRQWMACRDPLCNAHAGPMHVAPVQLQGMPAASPPDATPASSPSQSGRRSRPSRRRG